MNVAYTPHAHVSQGTTETNNNRIIAAYIRCANHWVGTHAGARTDTHSPIYSPFLQTITSHPLPPPLLSSIHLHHPPAPTLLTQCGPC